MKHIFWGTTNKNCDLICVKIRIRSIFSRPHLWDYTGNASCCCCYTNTNCKLVLTWMKKILLCGTELWYSCFSVTVLIVEFKCWLCLVDLQYYNGADASIFCLKFLFIYVLSHSMVADNICLKALGTESILQILNLAIQQNTLFSELLFQYFDALYM